MDSVRFGRALGMGARAAAKTLVTAVEAASSPNPSSAPKADTRPTVAPTEGRSRGTVPHLEAGVARTAAQIRQTREGMARGGRRFGETAWGPFVKLSGVLWLEFTGVFFGIFALFAATGAWKLRGDLRKTPTNHDAHVHLLLSIGMLLVFGYFFVSSFVKANRRGRGR